METVCPMCSGERFSRPKDAVEHVKRAHPERVKELLSKISPRKLKAIKNPENWAAGLLLTK